MRVLDVGCGANLIYPLLGAAMHGWAFVAADVTEPALEWAAKNRAANPHLAPLIEVRRSGAGAGCAGAACRACTSPLPAMRPWLGGAGCSGTAGSLRGTRTPREQTPVRAWCHNM